MTIPGRVSISPRALESLATGVAAEHLGVAAKHVTVRLSDTEGRLAVSVAAPLRTPALGAQGDAPGLITRSQQARADIARDLAATSGAQVGTVALRVTGIEIETPRRVS